MKKKFGNKNIVTVLN